MGGEGRGTAVPQPSPQTPPNPLFGGVGGGGRGLRPLAPSPNQNFSEQNLEPIEARGKDEAAGEVFAAAFLLVGSGTQDQSQIKVDTLWWGRG